jgi:hypothetical protein
MDPLPHQFGAGNSPDLQEIWDFVQDFVSLTHMPQRQSPQTAG